MVFITEDLVRKKSEHNECEICTLEELSLHQENIEKIEHLHHWCKNLQILLLQGNLISKIENLHKLKRLQYLNLALNNIEVIENLERCESLEKLDLTLNFIGDIESVESLSKNIHLKELFLTGNPCSDYTNYKYYIIAKLPQLENLDNVEITRSDRLKALQHISTIEKDILKDQNKYFNERNEQKLRQSQINHDEISDEDFWKQKSEHCPEVRIEMAKRQAKTRNENMEIIEKKPVILFKKDGQPLNVNQAKIKFQISYDNSNEIVLDLAIYKYLDTNLITVDIQPTFVTIHIKQKIFQLVLPEEILTESSTCQRSQTTGHLIIKMPKLNQKINVKSEKIENKIQNDSTDEDKKIRREYLEIGPSRLSQICNIAEMNTEFIDDINVPPLE